MNFSVSPLPSGYRAIEGSGRDRASLVRFLTLTYRELFPEQESFSHLAQTADRYFSPETLLYWVVRGNRERATPQQGFLRQAQSIPGQAVQAGNEQEEKAEKVACLWLGNGIDQVSGDRYAYIFLLYVHPEHRRRGIGSALIQYAHALARDRGDRQIGLHVFSRNRPALNLYQRLGYEPQSLLMVKKLIEPS